MTDDDDIKINYISAIVETGGDESSQTPKLVGHKGWRKKIS